MELLTNTGWFPGTAIEGIILQVKMAMEHSDPMPTRLMGALSINGHSSNNTADYGTGEAMEAYIRACKAHGWKVPQDSQDFSMAAHLS